MVMWLKRQPEVDDLNAAISVCCKMRCINKCHDWIVDTWEKDKRQKTNTHTVQVENIMFACTHAFCRNVPAFPGSRGVTFSGLEPENMSTRYGLDVSMSYKNKRIKILTQICTISSNKKQQSKHSMIKFTPGLVAFNNQKSPSSKSCLKPLCDIQACFEVCRTT